MMQDVDGALAATAVKSTKVDDRDKEASSISGATTPCVGSPTKKPRGCDRPIQLAGSVASSQAGFGRVERVSVPDSKPSISMNIDKIETLGSSDLSQATCSAMDRMADNISKVVQVFSMDKPSIKVKMFLPFSAAASDWR
jgi:hypothetical protein